MQKVLKYNIHDAFNNNNVLFIVFVCTVYQVYYGPNISSVLNILEYIVEPFINDAKFYQFLSKIFEMHILQFLYTCTYGFVLWYDIA